MPLLMVIEGLAAGGRTPFDGQYLKEYDPSRNGVDPLGIPTLAHVVTTSDPSDAMVFDDPSDLRQTWMLVDDRNPVRQDGRPNRPLTAFTISTVPYSRGDDASGVNTE